MSEQDNRNIIWQAKDFSIREFSFMYHDKALNLQPSYQRRYVATPRIASRLVESILMDVPIPVIYLAEERDSTYSVIDGQQRLTSFLSFMDEEYPDGKAFHLTGLTVFKELNKKKFSDLSKEQQNKIKTTTLHTIVIKKESNEDIKFEIFERLNTGSTTLNEDEIRNTIYRGEYIKLLSDLEEDATFHELVQKDNDKKRMKYRGMILRFLSLSEKTYMNYKPSMKQFCNKELRDNINLSVEKRKDYERRFKHCVEMVNIAFGTNAFRRYTPQENDEKNGSYTKSRINMALFDVQMIGFMNYSKKDIQLNLEYIREAMLDLMVKDDDFIEAIERATSDSQYLKRRFEIWFSKLNDIIGNQEKKKRLFSYEVKEKLFAEHPYCAISKQKILAIEDAEVDHIIPYSKGGETTIKNAQLTLRYFNRAKGNRGE